MLEEKQCADIADELKANPAVPQEKQTAAEAEAPETILPDGTILYGSVWRKNCFRLGSGEKNLWRILSVDEAAQTALVIAEDIICEKPYHKTWEDVTWEKCTLRAWLNGEYLEQTFSAQERAAIVSVHLKNPDNSEYNTKGGNDTEDHISLLSLEEVQRYFASDAERATGSWWWLRSPGGRQYRAARVFSDGSDSSYGNSVGDGLGIRPAFQINLKSEFCKSVLSKSESLYPNICLEKTHALEIRAGVVTKADRHLESVTLPGYVKEVGEKAFACCPALREITWQGEVKFHKEAFGSCPMLRLPAEMYCTKKKIENNFAGFLPTDEEAMAYVLLYQKNTVPWPAVIAERLTAENAVAVADRLLVLASAEKKLDLDQADMLRRFALAAAPVLGTERLISLQSLIRKSGRTTDLLWLQREIELGDGRAPVMTNQMLYMESFPKAEPSFSEKLPGLGMTLAAVEPYASVCAEDRYEDANIEIKTVIASDKYRRLPEVDAAAALLDHAALMEALKAWAETDRKWWAPYAVYASDAELEELLGLLKQWLKEGKDGKERVIRIRGAILLNDSLTAMKYAESLNLLDRYAGLRGMSADDIRDSTLSDFGLDENGCRTWQVGGKVYTARLCEDLSLSLQNEAGKPVRSIPKKNADPAEYEAASKELASLKKEIRAAAKLRNDRIFADFLSGRTRPGKAWRESYGKNPLLKLLARLIVWEQEGETFTLDAEWKAQKADGVPYAVTDAPVSVAHPMEMKKAEVEAWQDYFVSHALRQPFEQVWEPVLDGSTIKPDRYKGCTIPLYMLMNKDKHGITMLGQSELKLQDCSANLELKEGHKDWVNNPFEITNFRFASYTRAVNHIAVHFDKGTVASRILKDDTSVEMWLDNFTAAQIRQFIDLAAENNCTNVCALLLQYQHEHYEAYDPMAEFTLDLL